VSEERDNVIHVAFGPGGGRRIPPPEPDTPAEGVSAGSLAARATMAERSGDPTADLYGIVEAARVVGIPVSRLRSWARSGFLAPSARSGKRRLYTFQDLIGLRTAKNLVERGVPMARVRAAIEALRASLPRVTRPLSELRVMADGHDVVVRAEDATFEPLTGQLVLDFDVRSLRDDVVRVLRTADQASARRRAAYAYYLEGCRLDEDEVTFERAEEAYRKAIELDPSLANAVTNLGNLRFRRGAVHEAEALYLRALDIDPAQPEAHYNLGFLAYDRGDIDGAIARFRRAVGLDPAFADAHFNLAMALEERGRASDARAHWEAYLRLEPAGPWAEVARRHLARR
jgi:tetratricopeptide (TPR) repeat protein